MRRTAVACAAFAATFGILLVPGSVKASARAQPGIKTVRYDGYTFNVPANWPVYQLGRNSAQCVRYDRNAVYLGSPGVNQQCPPNLIGRAGTVSIAPSSEAGRPAAGPAVQMQSAEVGGGPAAAATPQPGVTVTATYGADPGAVRRVLSSLHSAGTAAPVALHQRAPGAWPVVPRDLAPAAQPAVTPAAAATPPVSASPSQQSAATSPAWPASPSPSATPSALTPSSPPAGPSPSPSLPPASTPLSSPSPSPSPSSSPVTSPASTPVSTSYMTSPVAGFDTCTAPSLQAMQAWRHSYSVAAIYIGGAEMACDYGNLSASWVRSVRAMGWSLIPVYVGRQAPCDSFSQEIQPSQAAPEGTWAASDAVHDAQSLGLGTGSPIYFDMEAYNSGDSSCRDSVLSFMNAWDQELGNLHYVSGMYSSAASGVEDMGNASTVYGRTLVKPESIWFALWDNQANLTGTPYVLNSWWTGDHRIKQYEGGHWVTVGGIKLDIDSDWVGGAVYG